MTTIERSQFFVADEFASLRGCHAFSHRNALFIGQAKDIAAPTLDFVDRLFHLGKQPPKLPRDE